MGDYTQNFKIGTCGCAYYATKKQLEKVNFHCEEIKYYLNPKNKAHFAFPLPEFDNQKAGDISIFHKPDNELTIIEISRENKTFHKKITHHIHPAGGHGINLFCECPYHSTENVSKNFSEQNLKFYLKYQAFTGEENKMAIVGECIYCGESNIFEQHEAEEAVNNLIQQAQWNELQATRIDYENTSNKDYHINKSLELREIAKRIEETYK